MTLRLDLTMRRRGIFLKLPSMQTIGLADIAGFDFVIVDLEHSQLAFSTALDMVNHAHLSGLPAIVRLPEVDGGAINRLLEAGAAGIQLSTVTSVSQVSALKSAMRYAPDGARSIGTAHRLARFGRTPVEDYVRAERAAPPLAVIQLETATTVSSIDELADAGADVVFVGQADLAVAFDFNQALVDERVAQIIAAARRADLVVGGISLDAGVARYDVVGNDLALIGSAFRRALA